MYASIVDKTKAGRKESTPRAICIFKNQNKNNKL